MTTYRTQALEWMADVADVLPDPALSGAARGRLVQLLEYLLAQLEYDPGNGQPCALRLDGGPSVLESLTWSTQCGDWSRYYRSAVVEAADLLEPASPGLAEVGLALVDEQAGHEEEADVVVGDPFGDSIADLITAVKWGLAAVVAIQVLGVAGRG